MYSMNHETEFGIPVEIPANGQDWANYIAGCCIPGVKTQVEIQVVLEFDKRVDPECMKKAVRLSVDAEPVLGCSFVEHEQRPYWRRLENIDDIDWCLIEQTQNREDELQKFLTGPMKPENVMLQAKIIRSDESDVLCMKLNHACCDGGGVKEYLQLLSDIYTHVCYDKDYFPKPNIEGKRDTGRVFTKLGIKDPRLAWNPQLAALKPTWAFPFHEGKPKKLHISIRRFDKRQFEALESHAKERNSTINDLILAAYYRVMFQLVSPGYTEPMEIKATVDLRRYLPDRKTQALCNLSGMANTRMTAVEGEPFDSTLDRVSSMMKSIKNSNPGIHSAAATELLGKMSYRDAAAALQNGMQKTIESGKSSPLLSNLGVVSEYPLMFGDVTVKDAYILTPAMISPSFMLGVSTYNGVLTLSAAFFEPTVKREDVEKFLDMVKCELLQ